MTGSPDEVLLKLDEARKALDAGEYLDAVADSLEQDSVELVRHKPYAAVLLAVRAGQQEAWSRREELSTDLYAKLNTQNAREGARAPISYRELDPNQPSVTSTCTNCRIKPGFGPCPRCSGVGVLLIERPGSESTSVEDCPDCEDGFATCTVCGGSQKTIRATVQYVNVKPFDTNHIVGVNAVTRSALAGAYPGNTQPHDALSYDLEGGQTAYRGRVAGAMAHFHGYELGDGVKLARAFVHRVHAAPNLILYDLRTYALPFVMAEFTSRSGSHVAAFFIDHKGNPKFAVV